MKIEELKRLAEAATIGAREVYMTPNDPDFQAEIGGIAAFYKREDARFDAAANPAAVLELIAEVERVTKQRDELLAALKASDGRLHDVATLCATVEQQRDELLEALKELFSDIQDLIGESYGVSGLHRNGDIAPWDELEPGGRFERLYGLISASSAIAKAEG